MYSNVSSYREEIVSTEKCAPLTTGLLSVETSCMSMWEP